MTPEVSQWSIGDVQAWLLQQGPQVARLDVLESFRLNEVDGETLLDLTPEDIRSELRISSLAVRKELMSRVDQVRHLEKNRHLKKAVSEQLSSVKDDLASLKTDSTRSLSSPEAEDDFVKAVELWQEDMHQLQAVIDDANFSNEIQSIEIGLQRSAEASGTAARELHEHLEQLRALECSDARAAAAVNAARGEEQVRAVLRQAQAQAQAVAAQQAQAQAEFAQEVAAGAEASEAEDFEVEEMSQMSQGSQKLESHLDEAASSSHQAPRKSLSSPESAPVFLLTSAVKCASCFDVKPCYKLSCDHRMCRSCLSKLFMSAVSDLTLWPVRCCKQKIEIGLAQRVLRAHEHVIFVERMQEAMAVNKMYCSNPYCSHFLNLDMTMLTTLAQSAPLCCASAVGGRHTPT
ncbi:unnamed protein product [Effrenium voratum]|nr:unnamed protein product [Effrenium voratum]